MKRIYINAMSEKIKLENTSNTDWEVELLFQPRGGASALSALLNNELISIPPVKSYEQALISKTRLKAGEEKILNLITMPEGGSNYPIRILIKGRTIQD